MGPAESLSLLAAFVTGVLFTLAASFQQPAQASIAAPLEPEGEPVIGPPPGWNS